MRQGTVLILDNDLGFSMWLGRALNEAGIGSLLASRAEEAVAMVSDAGFPPIDLLIVNFQIAGWQQVLEVLAAQGRTCKLISIGAAGKRAVDGRVRRPRGRSLPKPDRYVKLVRELVG